MKGEYLADQLLPPQYCVSEAEYCPSLNDLGLAISYCTPNEITRLRQEVAQLRRALIFVDATEKPELALRYLERLSIHDQHQHLSLVILLREEQLPWLDKARVAGATGYLIADQSQALRKAALGFLIPGFTGTGPKAANVFQWRWDRQSRRMRMTPELARQLDIPSEIEVRRIEDLTRYIHPDDRERIAHLLRRMVITKMGFAADFRLVGPTGRILPIHQLVQAVSGVQDGLDALRATVTINDRRVGEGAARQHGDMLTGLSNLQGAQSRIEAALARGDMAAVLILGVSRFERLNALWGRSRADEVLRAVGARLDLALNDRPGDRALLCRLGGTEFALVLEGDFSRDEITQLADHMLSVFAKPFKLGSDEIYLASRVGIAISQDGAESADILLRQANIALSVAKDGEPNEYRFFSPVHAVGQSAEDAVEQALRRAVERNELEIHYQPLVDIATRDVCGFEALMRWRHPGFGLMTPHSFLMIAERAGLMSELSDWVLTHAIHTAANWPSNGKGPPALSVNLSAEQFKRTDIVSRLLATIESARFDPRRLILELTETMVMEDMARSATVMHQIKSHGVRIAIDDFGTGYSSLGYLKHLPFCTLKVDRLFVEDLPGSKQDLAMLDAIVAMAKTLNMTVIAEGVEEEEQLECLATHGCDVAQGFLFAVPIAESEVPIYLANKAA